jgi:hypothetical protein
MKNEVTTLLQYGTMNLLSFVDPSLILQIIFQQKKKKKERGKETLQWSQYIWPVKKLADRPALCHVR